MGSKNLKINGEKLILKVQTIIDILEYFQLSQEATIVELNGEIMPRDEYDRKVEDGDSIELIRFVGGG